MTADDILAALAIPPQALVGRRVPKKLLLENGAPTAADKRAINEGVEEITWVASLKPNTVGVPAFKDESREYLEIAVLTLSLRERAKANRLRELLHRAIPYPLVLVTADSDSLTLSLAPIRFSQNEAGKTVLERDVWTVTPDEPLLRRLPLSLCPQANLFALYGGWCGLLKPLVERAERNAEIDALRRQAENETQLARRVELNLRIRVLTNGTDTRLPDPENDGD